MKHGHCPTIDGKVCLTPTYHSWAAMHVRCRDKSRPAYGGKGVAVCLRWHGPKGFEHFFTDLGPRPTGTTLDRKKNHLGYSKSNCRWATKSEQYSNRTSDHVVVVNGEGMNLADAVARYAIVTKNTARSRVFRGWDVESALLTPAKR